MSEQMIESSVTGLEDPAPGRWRLATKLALAIAAIVLLVLGSFIPVNLALLERHRRQEVVQGADQLSKTIISATWEAMLRDDRDEAYRMMRAIAQQPGMERVRIFNKEGRIMFSSRQETGTLVDKRAEACDLCHDSNQPLVHVDLPSRARVFENPSGRGRVLGLITPIYNAPACSDAPCHAHPAGVNVLGVLDVQTSLDRVDSEIASARSRTLLAAFAMILIGAIVAVLFVRRFVGGPIDRLIVATRAVSAMNLDEPIQPETRDEIGQLAVAFDRMRRRLRAAMAEINDARQDLEQKVEERTAQLRAAQETLVRKDRLACLGQLSASVAHEINNPLAGVLNYTMLMDRILQADGIPPSRVAEFRGYLAQASGETARVGRIVTGLLAFARQGKPNRAPHDLNEMIEATLALTQHKLEMGRVYVQQELDPHLPPVQCDGSQIRQVIMNLVMNAAEAMPDGGSIAVRTFADAAAGAVVIEVADHGTGIAEDDLAHVFDPFFTTKGADGTGLGLTVVYGIVTGHNGTIDVRSRKGEGTTFRITLPLRAPEPALAAAREPLADRVS